MSKHPEGFDALVIGVANTLITQVERCGFCSAIQLRELAIVQDATDTTANLLTAELYDAIMRKLLDNRTFGQVGDMLFVVTADGNTDGIAKQVRQ